MLRLKEIRENYGITQQDLADLTGIHKMTVSRYERGVLKPGLEHMIKICIILDTTPNDLLGYMKKYNSFTDYLMSLTK